MTLNDPSTRLVIARDYGTSVWPIRRIGFASSRTIFSLSFHELNRERRCNAAILRRFESRERSSSSWKVSTLFLRFPRPPTLSRPVLFFVSFHPSLRVRVRGSLLYPATNARALAIIRRKRARANLALLLRRHRANATRNETKEEEKKRKRERGKRKERERERERRRRTEKDKFESQRKKCRTKESRMVLPAESCREIMVMTTDVLRP